MVLVFVFLFYPTTLGLLIGSLSPFIFKEIIHRYVLTDILYTVFWLFSYFLISFFFCSLLL